jgi:hypothetical protein
VEDNLRRPHPAIQQLQQILRDRTPDNYGILVISGADGTMYRTSKATKDSPGKFGSAMAEARSADEPAHLTSHDFTEDRLRRLVREGIEGQLITIGRGAEILGLSLAEMRKLVSAWVE